MINDYLEYGHVLTKYDNIISELKVGVCLLNVTLRNNPFNLSTRAKLYIITACAYIVFGAFVFGLTTCQSIMQFIRAFSTHKDSSVLAGDTRYNPDNLLHAGHVK
ncbi:unnamed protein product [Echinostoma caproni]|uniref:Ion_trans_2 domain-containing protein n=1 Tax=Echinostoma caproni TaxID=27848 RepID=A0A183A1Q9_9TREM|nr:unnamed protein product [Echinostoma caproni]